MYCGLQCENTVFEKISKNQNKVTIEMVKTDIISNLYNFFLILLIHSDWKFMLPHADRHAYSRSALFNTLYDTVAYSSEKV